MFVNANLLTFAEMASGVFEYIATRSETMIRALMILLLCQLAGTIVQQATGLPIPGPVMGLVLLLALLIWRGGPDPDLHATAGGFMKYLGLLFVPAGVGVVTELQELKANLAAIAIAIPISSFLGLAVTGLLMQRLSRGRKHA